jgi:chromosome partitioning protein
MQDQAMRQFDYLLTVDELGKLTGQPTRKILQRVGQQDVVPISGNTLGIPPQKVKAYLSAKGVDYTFTVIAHINLKGGVGKTISSITAATRAVQYGFKTCIIDMDSQGSASLAFGVIPAEDEPIFADVWQRPAEMVMGSLKRIADDLYILPSSLENGLLDVQLINPASQKKAVRGVCDVLQTHGFDLVMLDCPPSLGTAVISTICAADAIIIPVCGDNFSLKGLELTLNEIRSICQTFNFDQPATHILYTKFDRRLKVSREILQQLEITYPDMLAPMPIRTSSKYTNVLAKQHTVFATTEKNPAREDYDTYVRYLLGIDRALQQGG